MRVVRVEIDERLEDHERHAVEPDRVVLEPGPCQLWVLAAAEAAGFAVMVTTDQEIPFQQNLNTRRISILVLCAPTNRLRDLLPLVPDALRVLDSIQPGQVIRVS